MHKWEQAWTTPDTSNLYPQPSLSQCTVGPQSGGAARDGEEFPGHVFSLMTDYRPRSCTEETTGRKRTRDNFPPENDPRVDHPQLLEVTHTCCVCCCAAPYQQHLFAAQLLLSHQSSVIRLTFCPLETSMCALAFSITSSPAICFHGIITKAAALQWHHQILCVLWWLLLSFTCHRALILRLM